jgi:hypothetical protein
MSDCGTTLPKSEHVFAFAATLGFSNLEPWLPFDFPGLIRLAMDAVQDARYCDSLATMVTQHVLLLGCLIAGVCSAARRKRRYRSSTKHLVEALS